MSFFDHLRDLRCIRFQEETAATFIHTFMRYVIAAYVICLRRLSPVVRNQFPTDEALVEAKLLTEAELGRWLHSDA